MTHYDHRTEAGKHQDFSFYVFEDLRAQSKGNPMQIDYYDTLEEAIDRFQKLPSGLTTALGCSNNHRPSDVDLIHRREGEIVLVQDFLKVRDTCLDPRIHEMALTLCDRLKIQWELDSMLGASILVPREYGTAPEFGTSGHDSYFNNKRLNYSFQDPDFHVEVPHKGGPKMAIEEVYVQDEGHMGYVPFPAFWDQINASENGYQMEHRPKVSSFHIRYVEEDGRHGSADVTPHMLREFLSREKYLEQAEKDSQTRSQDASSRLLQLAQDIDQFVYDFDTYSYQDETQTLPDGSPDRASNIQKLYETLLRGDSAGPRDYLSEIADSEEHDPWVQIARQLLSQLDAACPTKRRSLEHMVNTADHKEKAPKGSEPSKVLPRKVRE